ncbi:MAG: rRNA maturation RNase YbeY [Candidatus Omnitrophica bacterium]|nr:rRNA maturation RNase YbeY [Candidatus Omnitrophota bacterium]
MIKVNVTNHARRFKVSLAGLKRAAVFVLKRFRIRSGELNVLLVCDREIRRYNRRFLHRDRPTDVIAFQGECLRRVQAPFLGDIVISLERAKKQAALYKSTFKREAYLYLIHGILHIMGYDDRAKAGRRRMEILQASFLERIL